MIWITRYDGGYDGPGRTLVGGSGSGLGYIRPQPFYMFFIIVEFLSCIAALVLAFFAFFMVQTNSQKYIF
jgi:hypothetical protein